MVYIDTKLNKVVALLTQESQQRAEALFNQEFITPDLTPALADSVVFDDLKEQLEFTGVSYGGGLLITPSNAMCTTGFSVKNASNILGLSTAAHCSGVPYWAPVKPENLLTLVTKVTNKDVAWFRTPSNLTPQAQINKGSTFLDIKGTRVTKAQEAVCKYGIRTGYSCGKLISVGATGVVGGITVSDLIVVSKNGKSDGGSITDSGDSGGPLFISNFAVGTAVGGASTSPVSVFATVKSITAMGLTILTK